MIYGRLETSHGPPGTPNNIVVRLLGVLGVQRVESPIHENLCFRSVVGEP